MKLIKKYKLFVIVLAVAAIAAGAGLKMAGVIGGKGGPVPKVAMEPVSFTEPFIVNLADTDAAHYIKLGVAVQVEPMTAGEKSAFEGAGASHSASAAKTGAMRLAEYAPLRDAIYDTVGRFDSHTLLSAAGKEQLKKALLAHFANLAASEELPTVKGHKPAHNPSDPPYYVKDVYFTDFAVQ